MAKETKLNEKADIYQKRTLQSEREKLKDMSFSQKWTYFKDYYLLKTIVGVILIGFISYVLYITFSPKPDTAVYIAGVNLEITSGAKDKFVEGANEYLNLDSQHDSVLLDYSNTISDHEDSYIYNLTTSQKLAAIITSKELDIMIIDRSHFDEYATEGFFTNLTDALTPSTFNQLSEQFIMGQSADDTKANPYGISLNQSEIFRELYANSNLSVKDGSTLEDTIEAASKDYVLGILVNSQRKEASAEVINYLFDIK